MLEALKNLKGIGGAKICIQPEEADDDHPICINYEHGFIAFKMQRGPIGEGEENVNGCSIGTIIHTLILMVTLAWDKEEDPKIKQYHANCMERLNKAMGACLL